MERRREEHRRKQKEEMLEVVKGEDLSGIDLDSEEGMKKLESMVGQKIAENLMGSLTDFVGDKLIKKRKKKPRVKEIETASGEKKSVLIDDEDDSGDKDGETIGETLSKGSQKFQDLLKKAKQELDQTFDDDDEMSTAYKELTKSLKDIFNELDKTEAEIVRIDKEIKETDELLEKSKASKRKDIEVDAEGDTDEADDEVGPDEDPSEEDPSAEDLAEDPSEEPPEGDSAEEEPSDEPSEDPAEEEPTGDPVDDEPSEDEVDSEAKDDESDEGQTKDIDEMIKVTKIPTDKAQLRGLKESASEKRVVKHLESAIKDKFRKSGIDVGDRRIEIKVVSAGEYGGPQSDYDLGQFDETDETNGTFKDWFTI